MPTGVLHGRLHLHLHFSVPCVTYGKLETLHCRLYRATLININIISDDNKVIVQLAGTEE